MGGLAFGVEDCVEFGIFFGRFGYYCYCVGGGGYAVKISVGVCSIGFASDFLFYGEDCAKDTGGR